MVHKITSTRQIEQPEYRRATYSTVQYSTVQYSTFQYSTVQYSTVQYSPVPLARNVIDHILKLMLLKNRIFPTAEGGGKTGGKEIRMGDFQILPITFICREATGRQLLNFSSNSVVTKEQSYE